MKKTIFALCITFVMIFSMASAVFADAVMYDMEPADYYVYVTTPDGGLNMRWGPGTDYSKVMESRIPDNVRLHISYVSGNWGYTTYNGYEGWVALKQTSSEPMKPKEPKQPSPQQPPAEEPTITEPAPQTPAPQEQQVTTTAPQEDSDSAKNEMLGRIILIAIIIVLLVCVAVLLVVIINMKSRR